MKLYNTLSRTKEDFRSIEDKKVKLYTCGPTVYDVPHIGNLRCYIFEDVLKRSLLYNNYKVKHVMNITDVGHLTSDADTGEDKMEKSARKKKKSPYEIAEFYTKIFQENLKRLNVLEPDIWCKATDHIKDQIELIKRIEEKGLTYKIKDGIYFDTSKFPDYGKLARLDIKGLKAGARIKMVKGKKNITDFALWKFSPKDKKRLMEWDSPWGKGFPGWHLECAAMSGKYLGIPFDIHCGGIEHIPVHHTNEIAEAEAAFGKKFVNFWLHCAHLKVEGGKMAKSLGNFFTLEDVIQKGFSPITFRYLCLSAHYRSSLNFTWKGMKAIQNTLNNLYETISAYKKVSKKSSRSWEERFEKAINDDLNTPLLLSLLWALIRSSIKEPIKLNLLFKIDKVLGLNLKETWRAVRKIPKRVVTLVNKRERVRKKGNWKEADKVRRELKKIGWHVEDTVDGPKIKKIMR
ncbi:MAG: cysteine--tRNA ligase [Candidatus Bathyarchaeota archaeon]|nr:cysteine--tRNA ligase [Candidatus Bathyarchaeota archaeon]